MSHDKLLLTPLLLPVSMSFLLSLLAPLLLQVILKQSLQAMMLQLPGYQAKLEELDEPSPESSHRSEQPHLGDIHGGCVAEFGLGD